jgi:NAD(P)-dependent dehydrogenase (short-subunit alcohol dehydrogenase family)
MDGDSEALLREIAPRGITVITIEPGKSNGHLPNDPAAAADGIIAAVDADTVKSSTQ